MSTLYFGDCLDVIREHMPDESVDLIYLDPPFNSKRIYNASMGGAQWIAFKDTWQWYEAVDDFHELAGDVSMAPTMEGLRMILGEGFKNEIVWHYQAGTKGSQRFGRKHDIILVYGKTRKTVHNRVSKPVVNASRYNKVDEDGRLYDVNGQGNRYYLDEGQTCDDVWTWVQEKEFQQLNSQSKERTGYDTQKPLALLDRIIRASSNEDDVVLDPFCGCGTTIEAAQRLNRQWVGIDVCVKACQVIQERLERSFFKIWSDVEFVGLPMTLHHANVLAEIDKFKFEKWAASITPYIEANKLQVADKGIDGYGRIAIGKGKFIDLVSQVKGGSTSPGQVQAFNGARQQAGADLGIFTCFEERVTTKMREAAASTGKYDGKWPVVQIYTVDDFFAGRQPQLPIAFS